MPFCFSKTVSLACYAVKRNSLSLGVSENMLISDQAPALGWFPRIPLIGLYLFLVSAKLSTSLFIPQGVANPWRP